MQTVVIIEGDVNARELILRALRRAGLECVCACGTPEEALRESPRRRPGVVLMQIKLLGNHGSEPAPQIGNHLPPPHLSVLTEHEPAQTVCLDVRPDTHTGCVDTEPDGTLNKRPNSSGLPGEATAGPNVVNNGAARSPKASETAPIRCFRLKADNREKVEAWLFGLITLLVGGSLLYGFLSTPGQLHRWSEFVERVVRILSAN